MKKLLFLLAIVLFGTTSCATRVVHTTPQRNVVVVSKAPRNHTVVVVKGKRYYKWNGNHYRKTRRGYVLIGM
ncbi:hypothetical protein POV27_08300 [Aureisphaera galaxeae]|uniref:hypothetical protein n=1 Tax=Aureisphaera galaxeae TaxID=1538023 RepID=UPI002350293C|nr:hypothetical protein [Aureisphaera galaxeae]MDC8004051.1 hypothetical protein [Aureisphaera galaxeae]